LTSPYTAVKNVVWSEFWLWAAICYRVSIYANCLFVGEDGLCYSWGGSFGGYRVICALCELSAALPRSKAGVRSTSFGITPLFSKLYIPSLISFSVMGGGSAKGSSLNALGRILFGFDVWPACLDPIPSFSSSILLIPP